VMSLPHACGYALQSLENLAARGEAPAKVR
jgi:hypothetical protein